MIISVYYVYNRQFIACFQVEETNIQIFDDENDFQDDDENTENHSLYGIYVFTEFNYNNEYDEIYYDVNFNKIDKEKINNFKYKSKNSFDYDGIGRDYLYKSKDVVQQVVIDNIYFSSLNEEKYILPNEVYIYPENNTGMINLYDEYGKPTERYFHINGKKNGECVYYLNVNIVKENYVDNKKLGEYLKINTKTNNIKERGYYYNNKLEGKYIIYNDNNTIDTIKTYVDGELKKLTRFHKNDLSNSKIYIFNEFYECEIYGTKLLYHKSYYESGNIFLEIEKIDEDKYYLIHYFDNNNIAWKCSYNFSISPKELIIHEIYDENNIVITEEIFNAIYKKNQLLPQKIYYIFTEGTDVEFLLYFNNIFGYINY